MAAEEKSDAVMKDQARFDELMAHAPDNDALRASLVVVDQAVRKLAPLVAPASPEGLPPAPGLEQRWRALYSHACEAVRLIKS